MILVRFEPTFTAWRAEARRLLQQKMEPGQVLWQPNDASQPMLDGLGAASEAPPARIANRTEPTKPSTVPRVFLDAAWMASHHRDPQRWALLYRVLWRIDAGERCLMNIGVDPDIHLLEDLRKQVGRECHKMKAFVRFREVKTEAASHWVAWYQPEHDVVEMTAPAFIQRMDEVCWSILTPDRCAHWELKRLTFSPGAKVTDAPDADAVEELWRTYYRGTFNPARVNERCMTRNMPRRYWKNLPEAQDIAGLLGETTNKPAKGD